MNYDVHFKDAHLHSWPNAFCGFSRDAFDRNKAAIMAAAKKHGYSILGATPQDGEAVKAWRGVVHFMRVV